MSGRELPCQGQQAMLPSKAAVQRGLNAGDAWCHPCGRALCQAAVLPCCTSVCLDTPGARQWSRGRASFTSWLGRGKGMGKGLCSRPLSSYLCCAVPCCLRAGVQCRVTQWSFHTADTDILVWLLPILLNMSAVPSTDSCAVSSLQTSIQAASWGCWLFSACLQSVTGKEASSPNTRKILLGLSGRLPRMH